MLVHVLGRGARIKTFLKIIFWGKCQAEGRGSSGYCEDKKGHAKTPQYVANSYDRRLTKLEA